MDNVSRKRDRLSIEKCNLFLLNLYESGTVCKKYFLSKIMKFIFAQCVPQNGQIVQVNLNNNPMWDSLFFNFRKFNVGIWKSRKISSPIINVFFGEKSRFYEFINFIFSVRIFLFNFTFIVILLLIIFCIT